MLSKAIVKPEAFSLSLSKSSNDPNTAQDIEHKFNDREDQFAEPIDHVRLTAFRQIWRLRGWYEGK